MSSRFCERCERLSPNGNLWCPDPDCPAESGYPVFDYGDYLGELKVLKLISVWRTAALYEAQRGKYTVWVKVAHSDRSCEERLKREAQLLQGLTPIEPRGLAGFIRSFAAKKRPLTPLLLAAFTIGAQKPYGEMSVDGVPRVFLVMEPVEGALLSDVLLENPQVWHYEAAWLIQDVARALAPITRHNLMHLSLSPQIVMVHVDDEQHWRPTLLDLGWTLDAGQQTIPPDIVRRAEPAYLAPEAQLQKARLSADTYALGLMYYEMLEGRTGFEHQLHRDEWVRRAVSQTKSALKISRPELVRANVVQTLERAIAPGGNRYANVLEFAQALQQIYGPPPPEKLKRPVRFYVLISLVLAVLGIGLLFGLVVLIRLLSSGA